MDYRYILSGCILALGGAITSLIYIAVTPGKEYEQELKEVSGMMLLLAVGSVHLISC